ncbi:MAG: hypothetical protein J6Y14_10960, partial [Fibrobacter sp.]|nr:hypothetical protein [Fibrobacter sp.]
LNLWRGYGDGYNSIVIDYSTTHLELNKNTLGKPLIGKVVYDEREQKKGSVGLNRTIRSRLRKRCES